MNDGNVHGRTHGHDNKASTLPWASQTQKEEDW